MVKPSSLKNVGPLAFFCQGCTFCFVIFRNPTHIPIIDSMYFPIFKCNSRPHLNISSSLVGLDGEVPACPYISKVLAVLGGWWYSCSVIFLILLAVLGGAVAVVILVNIGYMTTVVEVIFPNLWNFENSTVTPLVFSNIPQL